MTLDTVENLRAALAAGAYRDVAGCTLEGEAASLCRARALARLGERAGARELLLELAPSKARWQAEVAAELAMLDLAENADAAGVRKRLGPWLESELPGSTRAAILTAMGIAENRLGRAEAARDRLFEAIALCEAADALSARAHALDALGITFSWAGEVDRASLYFTLALADWASLGNTLELGGVLANLGRLNLEAGRYRYALDLFRRAEALPSAALDERARCRMAINMGQCLAGLERVDEALRYFDDAEILAPGLNDDYLVFVSRRERAKAFIRAGDLNAATRLLNGLEGDVGEGRYSYERIALNQTRAELMVASGDARAQGMLEETIARLHQRELAAPEIQARQLLARALVDQGDQLGAERQLTAAFRLAKRKGLHKYTGELKSELGRLEIIEGRIGERDRPVSASMDDATHGYVTREILGRGAFGTVYRAFDVDNARDVALKQLQLGRHYESEQYNRLLQSVRAELESAARILHPGVARVYGVNRTREGQIFIAQELVNGRPLRRIMALPDADAIARDVVPVLADIAHALTALHDNNVVHRDLKPENIIVEDSGQPVLIDFGVAQIQGQDWLSNDVVGSLTYMAPEQAAGAAADGRADIYALGVVAYEWLVGAPPLDLGGRDSRDGLKQVRGAPRKRLATARPDVPRSLSALVDSMLKKRRWRRPATAVDVAARLDGLRQA